MKKVGFDERLDDIMVCAAIRLQKRMMLASSHGNLIRYLVSLGLWEKQDLQDVRSMSRSEIEDRAVMTLAKKLRRARKNGTLPSVLQQLNMLELLQPEAKCIAKDQSGGIHHPRLRMLAGTRNNRAAIIREERQPQDKLRVVRQMKIE